MNITDDDFTLFGLPPQQALQRAQIDARRRDLQAQVHPDLVVVSGLRPGAEVLGAEAALEAGVPLAAVIAKSLAEKSLRDSTGMERAPRRFGDRSRAIDSSSRARMATTIDWIDFASGFASHARSARKAKTFSRGDA